MKRVLVGLVFATAFFSDIVHVHARSASEWKSRAVYQVLTDRIGYDGSEGDEPCHDLSRYCGGTWKGIENMLDYIAGMGFDAIWISPIPQNLNDDYHGYAFLDLYQLNEHFGTEDSLKSLVAAAHERDIWIMLDVVGNHVAPVDLDFQQINPFNESQHYHSKCQIENWDDQEEVETCRLANLPDLDQNNSFVRNTLLDWVAGLKSKYNIDGLRVDTVPEVHPDFWAEFSSAAGMYTIGEVFNGNVEYVAPYQQYLDGVLSYPLYFAMMDVFANQQPMFALQDMLDSYIQNFENAYFLGNFIDNHDNARFLHSQPSLTLYKNALVMTVMNQGIPIVYYGTEQSYDGGNDPENRESLWPNYNTTSELYLFIQTLIGLRKSQGVADSTQVQRYCSDNLYCFSRDSVLVCVTNDIMDETVMYSLAYLPYEDGQTVCNVFDESDCITVQDGSLNVTITEGNPKIYTLQSAIGANELL